MGHYRKWFITLHNHEIYPKLFNEYDHNLATVIIASRAITSSDSMETF